MENGLLLGWDDGGLLVRVLGLDAVIEHFDELGLGLAAQLLVLTDDDLVKHLGSDASHLVVVGHPAVANAGNDAHLDCGVQLPYELLQGPHSGRVVRIVEQHLEVVELVEVEAARGLRCRRDEALQRGLHVLDADALHVGRKDGRQHVLDHEVRLAAMGQRDLVGTQYSHLPLPATERDIAILIHRCDATEALQCLNARVVLVHGEQRHVALHVLAHLIDEVVIGIEDGIAVRQHCFGNHTLHLGQLLDGVDAFEAQMVGSHVGDDAHIAMMETQPGTQHSATGAFEHREVDGRVLEHELSAGRACAVALHQHAVLDIDAIAGGVTHTIAAHLSHMGYEAACGGLAIGARDGDDRNAACVALLWEELVDHRAGHIARQSFGGREVHAETGACIHFEHRTARVVQRLANVGGHDVDAADVEIDDLADALGHVDVGRMNDVRHILGCAACAKVGGVFQNHTFARCGYRINGITLGGKDADGQVVDGDGREHILVAITPAWVAVHLGHQLLNSMFSIPNHVGRAAFGGRYQAVVDDQQTVIFSCDVFLDDDLLRHLLGRMERHQSIIIVLYVDGDPTAMIAVHRLHHQRETDVSTGLLQAALAADDLAPGHIHFRLFQQKLRVLLVAGQFYAYAARFAGHSGLYALLIGAIA